MKQGLTLVEMAQRLQKQQETKKDFITSTANLKVETKHGNGSGNQMFLDIGQDRNNVGRFAVTDWTHQQISTKIGIPIKFYKRLLNEQPDMLDFNVNELFQREPQDRMVRTLEGRARAMVSRRYRTLDNIDLAEVIIPVLTEVAADLDHGSIQITDQRLYIKALFPQIQSEVRKGDIVQSGIVVSNSEIGAGAVRIEPLIFRLSCLNGMISRDYSMKKYHLGRGLEVEEGATIELYTDETRRQADKAFWMKVRDVVRATIDQVKFEMIVGKLREADKKIISIEPSNAVEILVEKTRLTQGEGEGILAKLLTEVAEKKASSSIQEKRPTQYDLVNAVTSYARDDDDQISYDRATELETLAGQIIELPQRDWQAISEAA